MILKIICKNDSLSNHYEKLNLHRFVNDGRITYYVVVKSLCVYISVSFSLR